MAPSGYLLVHRDDGKDGLSTIYVAGIVVVGVIVLGVVIWLSIHAYKKRSRGRTPATISARDQARDSAFVEKDTTFVGSNGFVPSSSGSSSFSRRDIGGITMPEPLKTKDEILSYHRQNGTLTHAFQLSVDNFSQSSSPTPPSLGKPYVTPSPLNSSPSPPPSIRSTPSRSGAPGKSTRPGSSLNPDHRRSSFNPGFKLSSATVAASGRPISTISFQPPSPIGSSFASSTHSRNDSGSSLVSFFHGGGAAERTAHQTFAPVLPDELVIRVGERLTVVQNLDDGWCVVGRADANPAAAPLGVFGQNSQEGVEMGVVPAWVFIKPVKGLNVERPMRTTSLGITVQVPTPMGGREEVMSWSNF